MPTYSFRCAKDHVTDWHGLYSKRPNTVPCAECGKQAVHSFMDDLKGRAERTDHKSKWPIESVGAGVLPSEVDAERQRFPHHHILPNGRRVFHSWKEQDAHLRDLGLVNLSQS